MLRYFFSTLISGLLLFYGVLTLIFIVPDNYINIQLLEYSNSFNLLFYQRWGFFAPPPKTNERLYYIFENKRDNSKILVYEVLESILKEKYSKAPFNSKEDYLDYLISNSLYSLEEEIIAIKENFNIEDDKKSYMNKVNITLKNTNPYKTIMNYSKYVASEHKINHEDYNVSFKITRIPIPKFIDRNKVASRNIEGLAFDSKQGIQ
jgi:hypothetical protein